MKKKLRRNFIKINQLGFMMNINQIKLMYIIHQYHDNKKVTYVYTS